MDNIANTINKDLSKLLENQDSLNKIWNFIFWKFLHLENKIVSKSRILDEDVPSILEKTKEMLYLNVNIKLNYELKWSLNYWYSWQIEITDKNNISLFKIVSKEPVYWLNHQQYNLDKWEKHSTVTHHWDYYQVSKNDENIKSFLKDSNPDKEMELSLILPKI